MTTGGKDYHDTVSYDRRAMAPHRLDWAHPPRTSKQYGDLPSVPLPRVSGMPDPPAGEVLSGGRSPAGAPVGDLDELTMLLVTACSPTAVMRHAGGEHVFRSVPSAGALYPTEIYLACGKVQGLEDGLYHYEPIRGRLHRIRAQNLFPGTETTALRFFFSAVTFRSAWKYRARSYRYHLLDTGHAVEALVLALAALGRPATVGLEFDDDAVNRLLGLDTAREVALAWVDPARGKGVGPILDLPPLPDSLIRASRSSEAEVEYPELREIHERGKTVRHPVRGETASSMCRGLGLEPAPWSPLPAPGAWPAGHSFAETVHARRSSRNFVHEPMSREAFALLTAVLVARGEGADPHASVGIGLLVGGVEGTAPGFYLLDPEKGRHGSVRAGDYTSAMARISLDQAWAAGAALQVLFMADLGLLDRTRGARGYRHAMVAAGRLGHRVYLAATALGLGCCGIGAFYDREASELLGLAEDARLLYLLAVGPVQGGLRLRSR